MTELGEETPPARFSLYEYTQGQRDNIIVTESIFDDVPQGTATNDDLVRKFTNLTYTKIKTHLHIVTLSDYIRQQVIPEGLRWQKEPTLGKRTDEFCDRWSAILNKCSMDLMTLIVEQLKKDVIENKAMIETTQASLRAAVNDDRQFETLVASNLELQQKLTK